MRTSLSLAALAVTLGLAGCDFTPTLDIETPAFQPALVFNGVLAADSTVEVSITVAVDPYGATAVDRNTDDAVSSVPDGLTAEILEDGISLGTLRRVSQPCDDNPYSNALPDPPQCETMVSDVITRPGGRYSIRAQAPGFPMAEATVVVPERVPVSLSAGATRTTGPRTDTDLTITFDDRPGVGQRYALMVVSDVFEFSDSFSYCTDPTCSETRDTTVVYRFNRNPIGYTSSDPILLAGARTIPATGISFVTFTDEAFDGQRHAFRVRAQQFQYDGQRERAPIAGAWVVSIDAATFGAYQIAWFSLGDDNPFQEPIQLPSNVIGGYGLLGAVTITEALLAD